MAATGVLWVSISRAAKALFHQYRGMVIYLPEAALNCDLIGERILSMGLLNFLSMNSICIPFPCQNTVKTQHFDMQAIYEAVCGLKEAELPVSVSQCIKLSPTRAF